MIEMDGPVPIPVALREILIREIGDGSYPISARFPSERALAERYGVSRGSVRVTINGLVEEGRLVRAAGKGTFVAPTRTDGRKPLRGATRDIAFVISENIFRFVQPGYTRIMAGVEQVCRQSGCRLLFHTVGEEEGELNLAVLDEGEPQAFAGCIVTGGVRSRTLDRLRTLNVPIVLADLLVGEDLQFCSVGFDYAAGTRDALLHLRSLGHKQIGFIGFPHSAKYQTYWNTLEECGISYKPYWVDFLELPDLEPSILAGFRSMQRILSRPNPPTALLATNDLVAIGAMDALAMAGIRVPGQVSVVGFDDLVQDSRPPLTTVRVDSEELGRIAARTLLQKADGDQSVESQLLVKVDLVVRGTTAPPESAL